jgi:eukaryotic-like serine/threonine-protein kinase
MATSMDSDPWTHIERVFNQAHARPPKERAAFLAQACAGRPALRHEVELMLGQAASMDGLLKEVPTVETPGRPSVLIGRRLGAYQIVSRVAVGGMGEVYRAHDSRLSRHVAVKVLPADVCADPIRLRRFKREARAAALLNHPNILDIHDIGTEGNTVYLVHELLQGETLRVALKDGALPNETAIDYAVQIANGLAAAHEKGVIHRDLKPENIFITSEGWVKILDFGLAKLTKGVPASDDGTSSSADATGIVLGTPGYMSPEQVRGYAVDHRTDIFSLGAILYEMLSGARAFKGESRLDIMSNTLLTQAPPVTGDDCLLSELVHKCLEKDPTNRVQSCGDVQFVLNQVVRRAERNLPDPAAVTLAILPVETTSESERDSHRCVSATDALILDLVTLPDMRVISTASIQECQRRQLSLRALADVVGADLVVKVLMSRSASEVQFNVRILDPQGRVLWTDHLAGPENDFVAVQRAMSETVRSRIGARLRIVAPVESPAAAHVARQAHDHYVKGLYHWRKHTAAGWTTAAEWFKRSVAIDPSFAPAFAGLAQATYSLSMLQGIVAKGDYLTIKSAIARALELDPTLAEAHAIDARLKWTPDWDFTGAEAAFLRSLSLNPSSSDVNFWYATYLVVTGRGDEGLHRAHVALECDPVSVAAQVRFANVLHNAKRYDDAIKALTDVLDLEPGLTTAMAYLGCAYVATGQPEKGVELLKVAAADRSPVITSELAWAYARCGEGEKAEQLLTNLLQRRKEEIVPAICLAWCCASLGRTDEAFQWLQHAVRERCVELVGLKTDPLFDGIRDDPRFDSIVSSIQVSHSDVADAVVKVRRHSEAGRTSR